MDRPLDAPSSPPPRAPTAAAWHALPVAAALDAMSSGPEGLATPEAAKRLDLLGPNALPTAKQPSPLQRMLAQFDNLLIHVLLLAAVVTAILGHPIDTTVIVGVVVANAVIGYVQEGKAEAALDAIRSMISPKASVLRDGQRVTIAASDVVTGDVLLLEPGDRVTADVRLVKARNLRLDESVLTGESVPVEKSIEPVAATAAVADRRSMAFSGTLVVAGQGTGVVVATGLATELGRISALLSRVSQIETPMIRQMNRFARQLTFAILALSAATFAFAVLVRDYAAADAFMAVVGMAVAAIPEGLPAVMTIALAIGVQRMARRSAIIRRLPAVETLGSVSTICSDKTGTLTRNEMTVTRVITASAAFEVGGGGYEPTGEFRLSGRDADAAEHPVLMSICRAAILCNDASLREKPGGVAVDGDPMEGALMALGHKAGLERRTVMKSAPRLDEIAFDAAHRYMATLHRSHDGRVFACVKGAPERLLDTCRHQSAADGQDAPLDRDFWLRAVETLAADGRRVLALATRPFPGDKRSLAFGDVDQGLTLLGLAALIDPPRAEVIAAIAECREAGIAVKMITGDHAITASAIARELGLTAADRVLTGQDIDRLDHAALRKAVSETTVFARTSPEHKLRLVEALQAGGAVIAMTGDGVNDAPALKRADVGVAMGRSGTEAAKEAADMVLADDNFASIVAAVREGRTVYDNLTKVIGWTLPTNGGETLILVAAIGLGLTLPMTPVQILWINMVTAVGLGLVLAFEPAEPGLMQRPPRRADAPILSPRLMWQVALVSILFAIGAFGMFAWGEQRGMSLEATRTMVVNTVVVMEISYLFSVRYIHSGSITWQGVVGTRAILIGIAGVTALQLAFTYFPPFQRVFRTSAIGIVEALAIIGVGISLLLVLEFEKWASARRHSISL